MSIFIAGSNAIPTDNFLVTLTEWNAAYGKNYPHIALCIPLVHSKNRIVTEFDDDLIRNHIDGLPSQCGTLVAYDWHLPYWADEPFYKALKEHMDKLFKLAGLFGYSTILVTMPIRQGVDECFTAHGFEVIGEFKNTRSGNINRIFLKKL